MPSDSATKSESSPARQYIVGINHLGLAPKDPERARWFFQDILGLPHLGDELVNEQQTLTRMFAAFVSPPDPVERLEILVPSPEGAGAVGAFLAKKGSGIHHLALTVRDLDTLIAHLISKGVRMVDQAPRNGAHQTRIAFVHPESTGGLLIELVEPRPSAKV
ncbi:MAG: methylmalonyl-CoA epimerase [Deltaproteobacteria bacterium]|nr:methylmalonyl-CoA epimerase [Deltaproteobacteria bacterium]